MVTSHIPEPTPNFACSSPTTLSNLEIRSLELQRFHTLLKLHPIELHASFLRGGRIDTCWCRSRRAHVRCVVSRWPASVAAVVSLVSTSPRGCVLCAKKFALRGPMVGVSAKKFARRTRNGQNMRFMARWASFFAEEPLEVPCWANFFAEEPLEVPCRASFFAEESLEAPCWANSYADQQSRIPLGELFRGNAPEGNTPKELRRTNPRRRRTPTRAPAPRAPGRSATASCRKKIPTPRRQPTRSG